MWKQVMPLFVIAVLVGWMMPAADPPVAPVAQAVAVPAAANPKPSPAAQPSPQPYSQPIAQYGEAMLYRKSDGHFYAQGNADGAQLNFLVDTGASVVALTDDDAARIGLYWHPGELSMVGRGVNGDVMGKQVMLKQLTIGAITADNVAAVIIPNGLDVSLLGQSFLSRVGNVSISGDQMILKN
jgi:aspartyl protease family protein